MALQIELVSPERIIFSGSADMIVARTVGGGDIAFMDGHAPFVGALEIATATVTIEGREEQIAVHGGFVEVTSEGGTGHGGVDEGGERRQTVVTILSDVAELSSEIDVARARQAKERAEEKLHERHDTESEAELRRAHVRLAAAEAV